MPNEAAMFIGKVLDGRWHVIKELGGGGFGMVFAARDLQLGRDVAVKILRITAGADGKIEFKDEARFLARLAGCERIIDLLGHGEETQILTATTAAGSVDLPLQFPFMVLELADGCLTELLLLDDSAFVWQERLEVFRDVAKGIHQMHLKQMVDRDLKSENVLVFAPGQSQIRGKVADLGRARITSESPRFLVGDYLVGRGDLRFAAPELLWHQGRDTDQDWRAVDLYHLGSLLFELGTGTGITSVVLPDGLAIARAMAGRSEADRAAAYAAAVPDLVDRLEFASDLFAASAPAAIRHQLRSTLSQLTDPVGSRRFPRTQGRPETRPGLDWLLRRIDVIALTLRNADRQARRLAVRKGAVA